MYHMRQTLHCIPYIRFLESRLKSPHTGELRLVWGLVIYLRVLKYGARGSRLGLWAGSDACTKTSFKFLFFRNAAMTRKSCSCSTDSWSLPKLVLMELFRDTEEGVKVVIKGMRFWFLSSLIAGAKPLAKDSFTSLLMPRRKVLLYPLGFRAWKRVRVADCTSASASHIRRNRISWDLIIPL